MMLYILWVNYKNKIYKKNNTSKPLIALNTTLGLNRVLIDIVGKLFWSVCIPSLSVVIIGAEQVDSCVCSPNC